MNEHYINEIKKEYCEYMNKRICNYVRKTFYFLITALISGLTTYFIFRKPAEDKSKCCDEKVRYIVISYDNKRFVNQTLFCSEVRYDKNKKEVVCTNAETNDVYIFSYPVSIKNVTYTVDYLEYINKK